MLLRCLCLCLLLLGCGARSGGRDPVVRALRQGTEQLSQEGGLELAISTWLQALSRAPKDPRLLARLAEAYATRGALAGSGGATDLWSAREFGLRCLMLRPPFAAAVSAAGERITPSAVDGLQPEDVDCLRWTAWSWARWMERRGPAALSLDQPPLEALARRATALRPGEPELEALLALVQGLKPLALGGDPSAVEQALGAAARARPEIMEVKVDLALYGLLPQGRGPEAGAMLRLVAAAPVSGSSLAHLRDRAAIARAQERLQELPR